MMKNICAIFPFLLILPTFCFADDLESAAYTGNKAKVIRILKTKPNINHRDNSGGTALHGAMFQKDASIIILLLDYGFDLNAKGLGNGYTPLHDGGMDE
jgi:ankyrin repeat protein